MEQIFRNTIIISYNFLLYVSGLYGLVNNAGICVCGEFEWLTWKQIQHQVEVNLLGTMRVTKYCMPLLKATQGKVIYSILNDLSYKTNKASNITKTCNIATHNLDYLSSKLLGIFL